MFFAIGVLHGIYDIFQPSHTLWRNFPLVGRIRWFFEWLRPFLRSYIVESETEGRPFNHEERALVYRRAKNTISVEPFGSMIDFDDPPYELLAHSMSPKAPCQDRFRTRIGKDTCANPYDISAFNISAMSFGALGAKAIQSLSTGAKKGGFCLDTGEGGISRYHKEGGGDLIWQLGSGYYGARTKDGLLDRAKFTDKAAMDQVKMIEVKLSQGAKPGHGGVLPSAKISPEIAEARGIEMGKACISPPYHPEFSTPKAMLDFIAELRGLAKKPVGLKLCVGQKYEFFALCKAMIETGIKPDFIVVDGSEGGTGAAPVEFQDRIGLPLRDGLVFVRNALTGTGLKDDIVVGASGKITTAYGLAACMALGADFVNTGRGFMFALGCIQSLSCHTNRCPTGIATQDPSLQRGLVVSDKAERVYYYHKNTMHALAEVVGAAGCTHPEQLHPRQLMIRVDANRVRPADEVYSLLQENILLDNPEQTHLEADWNMAQANSFDRAI